MSVGQTSTPRMPAAKGFSLESFGKTVQEPGEIDVFGSHSLSVVRGEVDRDAVVHVKPFRMVIHLFDRERGRRHEAKSMHEVGELVILANLVFGEGPTGQAGQSGIQLGIRKFRHIKHYR